MVVNDLIPLGLVLLSVAVAVVIFPLPQRLARLRSTVNLVGAVTKLVLVMLLVPPVVADGARPEFAVPSYPPAVVRRFRWCCGWIRWRCSSPGSLRCCGC